MPGLLLNQASASVLNPTLPGLRRWLEGYLTAKRAEDLSPNTLRIYRVGLSDLADFCEQYSGGRGVKAG